MPNPFDQFDSGSGSSSTETAANPFDRLESAAPAAPDWNTLFSGVDGLNYRLPFEQRMAITALERGTQGEPDQRAAAINQAYVTAALPTMDPTTIRQNWPAIRESFARHALGIDKPGISDGEVYDAISAHEKAKQVHLTEEFAKADPWGKMKLLGSLFAAHSRENVADVWDAAKSGWEKAWTPFKPLPEAPQMPNVPLLGPNNPAVVAGIYNSVAKPFLEGLETPAGLATLGVGSTLKAAGTVAARRALAGMQFVFSGLMAKEAVRSTREVVNAPANPNATLQQQIEKWGKPVGEAGMALLAGFGGVMDLKTPAEQAITIESLRGKSPEEGARVIRNEIEATNNPDLVPPLMEVAKRLEEISPPKPVPDTQAMSEGIATKAAEDVGTAEKVIEFPRQQMSAKDRARMRMEELSQLDARHGESSLVEWIEGKLPHPDTAAEHGEPLAGELRALRDHFVKEDKKGRLNYGKALKFFAKKGEYRSLDRIAEAAREDGFNFQTPTDLLSALDNAFRGNEVWSQGGSAEGFGIVAGNEVGAMLHNEAAAAKKVISEVRALPEFKGFKEVLNKWVGDTQLAIMETAGDIRELVEAVPDELTRRAIGRWLDAGGDIQKLKAWKEASIQLAAKKEYAAALNLNEEQTRIAGILREWFRGRFDKAVEAGVMDEAKFRQDYLTQLIERPFVQGGDASHFGQQLNKNFKFSNERAFPNLFELEKAGFSAKTTDVAEIMARYDAALNKAIQSRNLIKDLLATKNEAGEPLAVALKGTVRQGEGAEPNFIKNPRQKVVNQAEEKIQALQAKVAGLVDKISNSESVVEKFDAALELKDLREEIRALREEQSPEDALLYKSIDHPALRKWWWLSKDEATGKDVFMEGDIGLHPQIKTHLENALGTSGLRRWYDSEGNALSSIPKRVVKALDVSNGFLKRNLLGGISTFHAVHELKRAAGNRVIVNPWNLKEIDHTDPRIKLQVRTGLMLATPHDVMSSFSQGLGEAGSLVDRVPVIGKFSKAVSEFTFQKLIPSIKSQVWDAVYDRNHETFKEAIAAGDATKEQVAYLTSHQINARFGHLNMADLGRNPTVQHWAQLLTLAPDFWESNVRNYGQTIVGLTGAKVGREPIVAFAVTGAAVWLTARVLNQALDDDWHFEEPFGVIHDGRKYTMRNEVEDLWRMFHNSRQYVMGRLSPTLNAAEEWRSGRNWRGEKVDSAEVFKNWVSKVFPMSLRWIPGIRQAADSLESGGGRTIGTFNEFLGTMGIQVARHSEIGDAYQLANDYKKAKGEKEDTGTYPVSPYQQLRYALEDGDLKRAKEELEKLTAGGEKDISRGFKQSLFHSFTGKDAEFEQGFRESLDASGKKVIEAADRSREMIYERYLRVLGESTAKKESEPKPPKKAASVKLERGADGRFATVTTEGDTKKTYDIQRDPKTGSITLIPKAAA